MEGLYWMILHFHHEGLIMDTQWRSDWVKVGAAACSLEILFWFSRNCKVRDWECVCGGGSEDVGQLLEDWWSESRRDGEAPWAPGGAEPRRMATLGQHVLQGWVLEEGYGWMTSCVVIWGNYDESFMIHLYFHMLILYILYRGQCMIFLLLFSVQE